ncbi:MAG: aminomethyltransferase [Oceanospirillaceae bacterium]|uniref:2Fe-2S iron-sulfur cluster-binding protein n=1 Tax=unclassified Thalassolituus TaxID=2624967 RepID=UPI000C4EE1A8|nr:MULTISPECIES: 2Fe-2S iron-sulfur cluster-binding protein [unclassified Thalassolituus]MAS23820.1 aminomethyltransferase [Oceanospirillaceae bacterium]MAY00838.1 aminomethyltransferase [Oceanospirillaceae bacterium]MBL36660.1 aminomethyltransferase [Oceanospirillaceae bacterium]MBS54444.1 aminomethyltransferase [Oceanospirillaceae bacterium]
MSGEQRLNAPMGLLIDRNQPVSFSFEGRHYRGFAGDSVASALIGNGQWLLSRSFKYHRPRSVLTMAGQDANTLVQLASDPNVLADRTPISEALRVEGQNYAGTLENDRDAVLNNFGRFMPVGFYYRAFYKPKGIWDWWEKIIRKKAGLGTVDLKARAGYHDKEFLHYDLVVVGAGPAGLSAALTAAEGGASVLLLDENSVIGGALNYSRFDAAGVHAEGLRNGLIEQVEAQPNIRVMTEATCNAWFTDNWLPVIKGSRLYKVRAKECIVAAGAYEQHVVFRNNDLPGVMMCSAAERLMKLYAVKPGNKAVVLAGNDEAYLTALTLAEQGVQVQALIDMRDKAQDSVLSEAVSDAGIKIMTGKTVYEALPTKGNKHIAAVDVRSITGQGKVADSGETIECDLLCMSAGFMPAYQLLCQADAKLSYDDERARFEINNLPPHLYIAGSVNGVYTLDAVIADGKAKAILALESLGKPFLAEVPTVHCDKQMNFNWPIFKHPKAKEFVDFDEDLQVKDIVNATRIGYRDVQLVKRFSTVGMGPSQGRHSALPTARLVANATDRTVSETGVTTARPPFNAEKLAVIAGRSFDPYRQSAMHHRHVELGAKMIPAGSWQRPAFYGAPERRLECIAREAHAVRNNVGVIDVSTLGGLELRGPDAAEFINRIYTFGFLKQPVGKTRYAVLTSEQGVVIDDGVSCRFAEDCFYVTATTTGVDSVYRNMQRWNAMWRLKVDIANVTSAFAAVNLAGPNARKVLEKITGLDVTSEGFPYLACREGDIETPLGSIPARLLRVGFVGELGYEIHVPSRYGEALWDAVMQAGAEFGITPFGVETQRLLRLEKGHIIVSQDTDGMSHPGELSLGWAINRNKPFFVGCRSVDIVMNAKQTRKLVGFTLPAEMVNKGLKPEEGHLVLRGDDISGNITSCEYSPALDRIIGLAYVGIDQAESGSTFRVRVNGGSEVQASVCDLPFYDADNKRQEM